MSSLLLYFFFEAHTQKPYDKKGCLIYTLGKDTTAIGNYELKGYDFSMRVADLTAGIMISQLKGTFFRTVNCRS